MSLVTCHLSIMGNHTFFQAQHGLAHLAGLPGLFLGAGAIRRPCPPASGTDESPVFVQPEVISFLCRASCGCRFSPPSESGGVPEVDSHGEPRNRLSQAVRLLAWLDSSRRTPSFLRRRTSARASCLVFEKRRVGIGTGVLLSWEASEDSVDFYRIFRLIAITDLDGKQEEAWVGGGFVDPPDSTGQGIRVVVATLDHDFPMVFGVAAVIRSEDGSEIRSVMVTTEVRPRATFFYDANGNEVWGVMVPGWWTTRTWPPSSSTSAPGSRITRSRPMRWKRISTATESSISPTSSSSPTTMDGVLSCTDRPLPARSQVFPGDARA